MVFNGIQQVFRGILVDLILLMVFNGDWEWEFFLGVLSGFMVFHWDFSLDVMLLMGIHIMGYNCN